MLSSIIKKNVLKTLLLILVLLFLVGVVSAQSQEAMCLEPNAISPPQVLSCLEQGLTQLSMILDVKLAEVLGFSPEEMLNYMSQDSDLLRALKVNPSLLDDDIIYQNFDSRLIATPSLVNDFKGIKSYWFSLFDVTETNCNITFYNGSKIMFSNKLGFSDINNVAGVVLDDSCFATIPNSIIVKKGTFDLEEDDLRIINGELVVPEGLEVDIYSRNTQIFYQDILYESADYMNSSFKGNTTSFSGELVILNTTSDEIKYVVDGGITFNTDKIKLKKESIIKLYKDNGYYLKINSPVDYELALDCSSRKNCVMIKPDPLSDIYALYSDIINDSTDAKQYVDEKIKEYKLTHFGQTTEGANDLILIEINSLRSINSAGGNLLEYIVKRTAPPPVFPDGTSIESDSQRQVREFLISVYDNLRFGRNPVPILNDHESDILIAIFDETQDLNDAIEPVNKLLVELYNLNTDSNSIKDYIKNKNLTFQDVLIVHAVKDNISILDVNNSINTLIAHFGLGSSSGGKIFLNKEGKAQAVLEKSAFDLEGNPSYVKMNLFSDYETSSGETHELKYEYGELSMCSDCVTYGLYTPRDENFPDGILYADSDRLAEIVTEIFNSHLASIAKTNLGTHYGSEWYIYDSSKKLIRDYANRGTKLKRTSCIGYALETLNVYYSEVGGSELSLWKKVKSRSFEICKDHPTNVLVTKETGVLTNGLLAICLAQELEKVGWEVYAYANSKQSYKPDYDTVKRNALKFKKMHPGTTNATRVPVVGFIDVIDESHPFGNYAFGATRAGGHVWNIIGGSSKHYEIYEVHYDRSPSDQYLFESPLNDRWDVDHTLDKFANSWGFLVAPPKT